MSNNYKKCDRRRGTIGIVLPNFVEQEKKRQELIDL